MRDLAISCSEIDWQPLLEEWRWLVPHTHVPLLIGAFGDWVIGAPDKTIWSLDLLEGDYRQIAADPEEFNLAKLDAQNLDEWFSASWVEFSARVGLVPKLNECLGWKIHPRIGGPFATDNIQIFSLMVYQSLMGQLHRQMSGVEDTL